MQPRWSGCVEDKRSNGTRTLPHSLTILPSHCPSMSGVIRGVLISIGACPSPSILHPQAGCERACQADGVPATSDRRREHARSTRDREPQETARLRHLGAEHSRRPPSAPRSYTPRKRCKRPPTCSYRRRPFRSPCAAVARPCARSPPVRRHRPAIQISLSRTVTGWVGIAWGMEK